MTIVVEDTRKATKLVAPSEELSLFVDEKAARRAQKSLDSKLPALRLQTLASMFAAFGDPTRLKLLFLLCEEELSVGDLATITGVSQSAISHQLSGLRALHLVKTRRSGRNTFYSADDEHIVDLLKTGIKHVREQGKSLR